MIMKKWLSHFAYNQRSRSGWTLSTPLKNSKSNLIGQKTVTYVPGTFVTLVPGPNKRGKQGDFEFFHHLLRQGEASGCHHLSRYRIKLLNELPPVVADTHVKRPSEIPRILIILGFEGHSWRVKTLPYLSGCVE
jgi:hypothetical protein